MERRDANHAETPITISGVGTLSQGLLAALALVACGAQNGAANVAPATSASTDSSSSAPTGSAPLPSKAPNANVASMAKSDRHDAIHQVLRSKRKIYRECFNVAHAAHPELEFAVVTFAIDLKPSGEIELIKRVEGTPSEQTDMIDCMTAAIRSLTFPPHPKGKETKMRYPLEYNSR